MPEILTDPWLYVGRNGWTDEQRSAAIRQIRHDPLTYGIEPSIWWVADALIDFPLCTNMTAKEIKDNCGLDWDGFKVAMRKCLGWEGRPARSILLCGAWRSSKSEYAAKRGCMIASTIIDPGRQRDDRECVMGMHSQIKRSKVDQQPLFIRYLPPKWREYREGMGNRRDFAWIERGYFGSGFHKLPNGRRLDFATYSQNVRDVLEGKIVLYANPDEKFPLDWLETLEIRSAQANGYVVATYTPVDGWTSGMGAFCDGMTVLRYAPAYLLPTDGGAIQPWLALGLKREEYDELERAEQAKDKPRAPACRPQNCLEWLKGKEGLLDAPQDRTFGKVPRVGRSKDGTRAIVWLHPLDNPWGNPKTVVATTVTQGTERIKRSIYGIAQKGWGKQFGGFDWERNTCDPANVPKCGRNFQMTDPAMGAGNGRNYFMGWGRISGGKTYIYREWPGGYWIPGVGVPEEWCVPSGRDSRGRGNDGDKGGAQQSWGFGLLRYKFEIARLEGWADWHAWRREIVAGQDDVPACTTEGPLIPWDCRHGAMEPIVERLMDCRSGNMGHTGVVSPVTLREDMNNIGLIYVPTSGQMVDDGAKKVNSMFEAGSLVISRDCKNILFAVQNWTGVEGQRGACKDPIDIIIMLATSGHCDRPALAKEPAADLRELGDAAFEKVVNQDEDERSDRKRGRGTLWRNERDGQQVGWVSGGRRY